MRRVNAYRRSQIRRDSKLSTRHGEEGLTVARAYVVARGELDDAALRAFVRERLSGHKVPRLISFVDELPKTPSGKIDRRALREPEVVA